MAKEIAKFPGETWDGLSRNEQRETTLDSIEPNPEDWNQIVAEMIAVQVFVAAISTDAALLVDGTVASTGKQEFKTVFQQWNDATDEATITFDLDLSNKHRVTLTDNRTLALSNPDGAQTFTIRLEQDGGGSNTVTWFSTIKWAGGSEPTLTITGGKADTFMFIRTGTDTYDGFIVGQDI